MLDISEIATGQYHIKKVCLGFIILDILYTLNFLKLKLFYKYFLYLPYESFGYRLVPFNFFLTICLWYWALNNKKNYENGQKKW